jgi:hypothetical protein
MPVRLGPFYVAPPVHSTSAFWLSTINYQQSTSAILLIVYLFHPIDRLAVQRLLNGDVRHRDRRRRALPMLFTARKPDYIAGRQLNYCRKLVADGLGQRRVSVVVLAAFPARKVQQSPSAEQ